MADKPVLSLVKTVKVCGVNLAVKENGDNVIGTARLFNPTLAHEIGLPEAIFLEQLDYLCSYGGKKQADGKQWVYNSAIEWGEKHHPYWSVATIKRLIASLRKRGFLLAATFNKKGYDRTLWYRVNTDKVKETMEAIGSK